MRLPKEFRLAGKEVRVSRVGHCDLLIAAQARRHGATLVTANQREFARVPGLDVVDWATPEEI